MGALQVLRTKTPLSGWLIQNPARTLFRVRAWGLPSVTQVVPSVLYASELKTCASSRSLPHISSMVKEEAWLTHATLKETQETRCKHGAQLVAWIGAQRCEGVSANLHTTLPHRNSGSKPTSSH